VGALLFDDQGILISEFASSMSPASSDRMRLINS
jgi:hypothetical protein